MTRCSVLRNAALGGTVLVALSVVGAASAEAATNQQVHMSANLSAADSDAMTYDPQLAPAGSNLAVDMVDAGQGATKVSLTATGLAPDQGYTAYAHVNPCGPTAADAGAHFRNTVDPAAGTGPSSAAPARNEVALDLHTDANGDGRAETDVPFTFDTRSPGSVVLQEAGSTGAPAACITLPTD